MNKPTILTFNFNGYDTFHSHFYTNDLNYVLVTDDITHKMCSWNIQYPSIIHNMSDWEKTLYVRYHPFEFTDSDIVAVIDGSMVIGKYAKELIDTFKNSDYDIAIPLSHQSHCSNRIIRWYSKGRITNDELNILLDYLKNNNAENYNGCLAGAIRIIRKNYRTIKWLDDTYKQLYKYSINGKPIRLDEIIATITLCKQHIDIKCMPLSTNVMDGDVFQYTKHQTGIPVHLPILEQVYFKNEPIKPIFIGPEYRRIFSHKSEAMCLTKFLNEDGLIEWIEHHLNLGFDHLHIFNNESSYPCEEICKKYKDNVSYELIKGSPRHYKIFNNYINSEHCKSEWVIPIDDDEYLELNTNICGSVNELIDYYINKFPNLEMFAIRWKHLFPKKFHTERTGKVLDYCTEENPQLAKSFQKMGDRGIKTFVHRFGKIYYEETQENPHGGHVPKHSISNWARLFNGELINTCSCKSQIIDLEEPARLLHCRFKGYTWYINKNKDILNNKISLDNDKDLPYTHYYNFNNILETLP